MFSSLLVANRGEIACRIFRTAKRMGMETVAVYSDADAKAKHVREADTAVRLGPPPAAESYLRGDLIIAAAKDTGAEAIHPGYGFLSENPEFAEAVVAAGLIWIGPTPAAIRAMGLKDEAKRIAIAAGVPVLEGYQGADQSEKRLLKAAKDIGFPVLIKAVAGGGGRGIREVTAAEEFKDQLASAKREAKAAFGNDDVLIERLVQRPRHIEVQVFGDKHGEVVHLFERDCSLQRRRQKVIEEAPAPGMTDEVRAAMTEAAVKLARAVSYENAGTVEFIVDGNGPLRPEGFWFLEMNTRLQVEHPVTEMITGEDLVEWQFRVAAGETLPKRQEELSITGHAIEARICAEDPAEGFRPSVGRIKTLSVAHTRSAELHAGFDAGDTVSSHYDSLLAKAVVHANSRLGATLSLQQTLAQAEIDGVASNCGFLEACLAQEPFSDGAVHTGLIAESLIELADRNERKAWAAALLALRTGPGRCLRSDPWSEGDGFRLNGEARTTLVLEDAVGHPWTARVVGRDRGAARVRVNDREIELRSVDLALDWAWFFAPNDEHVLVKARFLEEAGGTRVLFYGEAHLFAPPGASAELHAGEGGDEVKAPLPGKIVAVSAKPGQGVKKGDVLLTLEAMKMEHGLKAPRDGVVALVSAEEGAQVKEGAVLVTLEPEG